LLALAALAGLAGSTGVLRRRRIRGPDPGDDRGHDRGDPAAAARPDAQRDLSAACLLFFAVAVTLLLASDAFEFSWRYQLPALITLPPAGVLGILAIIGARAGRSGGRTRHEVTAEPTRSALPGSSPVS
jgi:hypothetical protein